MPRYAVPMRGKPASFRVCSVTSGRCCRSDPTNGGLIWMTNVATRLLDLTQAVLAISTEQTRLTRIVSRHETRLTALEQQQMATPSTKPKIGIAMLLSILKLVEMLWRTSGVWAPWLAWLGMGLAGWAMAVWATVAR